MGRKQEKCRPYKLSLPAATARQERFVKNLRIAEDDFLSFITSFIERRTSLQWIVELEGNIRGNDYLMMLDELGSG